MVDLTAARNHPALPGVPFLLSDRSISPRWSVPVQAAAVVLVGIALGLLSLRVPVLPQPWGQLLLLVVLSPFILAIVGDPRLLLLAVIILDAGLDLDVNLGYRLDDARFGAVGGLSVSASTVALLILYALWFTRLLSGVRGTPRPAFGRCVPLVTYLAFVVLSVATARDLELAVFELFILAQLFLVYLYVASTVRTRRDVFFVVGVSLAGLVFESMLIIGQRITGQDFGLSPDTGRYAAVAGGASDGYRASGTMSSPTLVAAYLSLLLPLAVSVLLTRASRIFRLFALFASISGALALVFTLTRGAWAATSIASVILGLAAFRRGRLSAPVLLAMASVMLVIAIFFSEPILSRLGSDDGGSAESRIPLVNMALTMIDDHIFWGVGANNFVPSTRDYATSEFGDHGAWLYVVHNTYLRIWAETGLGALLAFTWFLVSAIGGAWRRWSLQDGWLSPLALGISAALVGHLCQMMVEIFNGRVPGQLVWLLAGLVAAMGKIDTKRAQDEARRARGPS